jgi:hypothetical protein
VNVGGSKRCGSSGSNSTHNSSTSQHNKSGYQVVLDVLHVYLSTIKDSNIIKIAFVGMVMRRTRACVAVITLLCSHFFTSVL